MADEPTNAPDPTPVPDPVSAPPATPPQPVSFIDGEGTFTEGWKDKYISENVREDAIFTRIKTIQGLTTQVANLERMKGADTIPSPSDRFTDEDWNDFHKAGGWTGEVIPITAPEGLPEGAWSEDRATKFSEKFNELRLNPIQVAGLVEAYNADLLQQVSDIGNDSDTAVADLKASLLAEQGNAYTQFVHNGNIALEKGIDSPEHKERVLAKFANDPDFVRMMGNLGANFQEAGGIPVTKMAPSPTDIQTKIDALYASDAYKSKDRKTREGVMKQLDRLTQEKFKVKQPA